MPSPPRVEDADVPQLILSVLQVVQEERLNATTRHDEVLGIITKQQEVLQQQIFSIHATLCRNLKEASNGGLQQHVVSLSAEQIEAATIDAYAPDTMTTDATSGKINRISTQSSPRMDVADTIATSESTASRTTEMAPTDSHLAASSSDPTSPTTRLSKHSKLQFRAFSRVETPEEVDGGSWRRLAWRMVNHDNFEMMIAALIMANALVMCLEVQQKGLQIGFELQYKGCEKDAKELWPLAHEVFIGFDWLFGVLYFGEALLKLFALRYKYFCDLWSWLDLMCVLSFILDKAASGILPGDAQSLRLIRLARLMRLIRLIRTLEQLDALYIMATAIRGMSMILACAVGLLSVMLLSCALVLSQILHTTYFSNSTSLEPESHEMMMHQEVYEYFGTFTRCFLSMFEIALANWPPVIRLLTEEISEWFVLFGIVHKLTIGFAVVGVINGVILQETFKVASTDDIIMVRQRKRAAEVLKRKMVNLMEALDHSGDGLLDFDEFAIIANHPEVKLWMGAMDIETDDLPTLFQLLDANGDGAVSTEELTQRLPRLKGAARSIDLLSLKRRIEPCDMKSSTNGNKNSDDLN
jgi:hypothetical protein